MLLKNNLYNKGLWVFIKIQAVWKCSDGLKFYIDPKIEKRGGYRYCSSKGEEKGVQYTPFRPLSTNLSFNQVLQVLNKW